MIVALPGLLSYFCLVDKSIIYSIVDSVSFHRLKVECSSS